MKQMQEAPLLTPEEARTDPRYFGSKIGRNAFYEAIRRGEFPVITVGRRKFLIRTKLDEMLRGEAA